MNVLGPVIQVLSETLTVLRPAVFGVAVASAVAATASWAVRTRRVSPFSAFARLTRKRIDPLFLPAERRVLRHGGQPAHAPWWALGLIVIGGLILLSLLEFLREQLMMLMASSYAGPTQIGRLLVNWVFMLLKVALIARVISSWVGGSRYSKWWGWSFKLTDWFLEPLRRALPTFGMIDISPIVAYFGLSLLQYLLGG
ncbi:MAG: YggT family protein [Gemmatimonas sp.]